MPDDCTSADIALQCYSIRQLSPFQGTVQVINTPSVRAISVDGIHWQIQVTCEQHQQEWGLNSAVRRYVLWGVWSERFGLKSMPLEPMLDVPKFDTVEQHILPILQTMHAHIPFTQRDAYELWILDSLDQLPIALIATRTQPIELENFKPTHWRASTAQQRDFKPARAQTSIDPLLKLEQLISDNTCCPIRSQWFVRDKTGSGTGLCGQNITDDLINRTLPREAFPELLIREDWPNNDARMLAEDYHHWMAPRLLLLQHLSESTRSRLEKSAQAQAVETSKLYHLYPTFLDQKILNRILVETRLRQSAEKLPD
jgi:hypothetical protein